MDFWTRHLPRGIGKSQPSCLNIYLFILPDRLGLAIPQIPKDWNPLFRSIEASIRWFLCLNSKPVTGTRSTRSLGLSYDGLSETATGQHADAPKCRR